MDVYKIGIEISMINGVGPVLQLIQKQMLGLNAATMKASAAMSNLKVAIIGASSAFVGVKMLEGLSALTKHGEEYTHQLEMMKTAGLDMVETQNMISTAHKVSASVMTTTPAENIKTAMELRNVLASADIRPGGKADNAAATREAVEHLETFQKISGIMASQLSKNGKPFDGTEQAYQLAKSAEMLGLSQNPKRFDEVLEGWTKAIIASGGLISGTDIFQNVKYLRGAGLGMDMSFLTQQLPTLAQEYKIGGGRGGVGGAGQGGGAGNPLASLYAEFVGGVFGRRTLKALRSIDMIDETKIHEKKGRLEIDQGAVRGYDIAAVNLYKFVTDVLQPAILKHKSSLLDINKTTGEFTHIGELKAFLAAVAPVRTSQQALGIMLMQQSRIQGDIGLQGSAMGIQDAYDELQNNDPTLVREKVQKQLETLLSNIAVTITPMEIAFLNKFADALSYFAQVVDAHPLATEIILGLVAAFAALLVVLGSFAVAAAGVAAISGLAAALGGLGIIAGVIAAGGLALATYIHWDEIADYLKSVFQSLQSIVFAIGKFAKDIYTGSGSVTAALNTFQDGLLKPAHDWGMKFKAGIAALWSDLVTGLESLVKNLRAWFANLPSRLWASISSSVMPSAVAAEPGAGGLPGPRVPPPQQGSSLGSPDNPVHTTVTNQTSGRDILHGVAGGMGRSLSGPTSGTNWYDPTMNPALQPLPF